MRDHDVFLRVWTAVFTGVDLFAHSHQHQPNGGAEDGASTQGGGQWHIVLTTAQQQALMKRMRADVFAKTPEELQAHVDWYVRVLELTQHKKQLLADWRKIVAHRQRKEQGEKAAASVSETTGQRADELLVVEDMLDQLDMTPGVDEEKRREQRLQAKQRLARWKQEKQQKDEEDKVVLLPPAMTCGRPFYCLYLIVLPPPSIAYRNAKRKKRHRNTANQRQNGNVANPNCM